MLETNSTVNESHKNHTGVISNGIKLIKPYFVFQIFGLIMTFCSTVSIFAIPLLTKYLFDEVLPSKSYKTLIYGIGIFFAVGLSQPIISFLKNFIFINITEKITMNLRKKLFEKIIFSPIKFFDKTKNGEMISRITGDGGYVGSFLTNFFISILNDFCLVIMCFVGMFFISKIMTMAILFLFLIAAVVNLNLSKKVKSMSADVRKNYDNLCVSINQSIDSIMTIKSFLLENEIIENNDSIINKTYLNNKKLSIFGSFLGSLTSIFITFCLGIIFSLGAYFIIKGTMTVGSIIALSMYFQILLQPIMNLLGSNISIQTMKPIFERLFEYINMENEDYKNDNGDKLSGNIKLKNITFSYDEKKTILKDINLEINDKSFTSIVGKSGTGKSTLIKLIMGLYKPSSGSIYIGGKDISVLGIKSIRRNIGFVPQNVEILNQSVIKNLKYGNKDATDDEVIAVCKKTGIHDRIVNMQNSYDTIINERVNLSGGEVQMIGIARALLKKPSILILDEPTSNLDPENEKKIRLLLEKISKDCTVIVIAHKISTIKNSDKIFLMDNGKILEDGDHETLLKKNGFYSTFISGI